MSFIDSDKVKALKNGDFSDLDLDYWFRDYLFDYIHAIVEGCDKNLNFDVLNLISIYAQYLMANPNAKEFAKKDLETIIKNSGSWPGNIDDMSYEELIDCWNKKIVKKCERILCKVILIGSKHYEYYKPILDQLSTNVNDNVRLYCCANLNYTDFFGDKSPRVVKVAKIRYQFQKKWDNLCDDDSEKQRIKFLTAALETNAIQCYNGCIGYDEEDKMFAIFRSLLFTKEVWRPEFDEDIMSTIQDKRILANTLNELIKSGEIISKEGILPDCFGELNEIKKI